MTARTQALLDEYQRLLGAIRDVVVAAGRKGWGDTLSRWYNEVMGVTTLGPGLCSHVRRSWIATAGMGSLGDIVLGYGDDRLPGAFNSFDAANDTLSRLVSDLYHVTTALASALDCPPLTRVGPQPW
jgi:hypothetical protein